MISSAFGINTRQRRCATNSAGNCAALVAGALRGYRVSACHAVDPNGIARCLPPLP